MLRQSLFLVILCGFGRAELDLAELRTLVYSGLRISVPAHAFLELKIKYTHAPEKKAFVFLRSLINKEGIIGNVTSINPVEVSCRRQFQSWTLECDAKFCEFNYTKKDKKAATSLEVSKIIERGIGVNYVNGTVEHLLQNSDQDVKLNVVKTEAPPPSPAFIIRISLKSLRGYFPALDKVEDWTKLWYSAPEGKVNLVNAKPTPNANKYYYFENVEPTKEKLKDLVAEECITVVNVLQSSPQANITKWQKMLQVQVPKEVVWDKYFLLENGFEPSTIPSMDTTEWLHFEFNRAD